MAKKSGLGKGLDALFLDNASDVSASPTGIKIAEIEPNKSQPRKGFDAAALEELASSIKEYGLIQPIVVRPLSSGGYQIIAGERRWRAARLAGLAEIPAIIKQLDDLETMEMALVENLQREDLNILEEAQGYKALMDQHNMTQEQVAKRVGKSRPTIANAVRILNLPDKVLDFVREDKISSAHARVLAGVEDEALCFELAERVVQERMSVRALEHLAKSQKKASRSGSVERPSFGGDSFYKELEIALQNAIGRRVRVKPGSNGGLLEVEFFSKEDLAALALRFTDEPGEDESGGWDASEL